MIFKQVSKGARLSLESNGASIIGLNIQNKYFQDDDNLKEIISWSLRNFPKTYILLPDEPAVATFMAYGYNEKVARQKANQACLDLQSRCFMLCKDHPNFSSLQVVRWRKFEDNKSYKATFNVLKELYETNASFRRDVRADTMRGILHNGTLFDLQESVDIGIDAILKELAFVSMAPTILNESATAYLYHHFMPLLDGLLGGMYGVQVDARSGFIIGSTEKGASQAG